MSWLSRSPSNSMATPDLKNNVDRPSPPPPPPPPPEKDRTGPEPSSSSRGAGVKEDLTELTETLSRQFWGVASFLAPQPPPPPPPPPPPRHPSTARSGANLDDDTAGAGIRGDFAEIGGRFRSRIGRIASNFLPPFRSEEGEDEFLEEEEEEEGEEVVGVTDEVMAYARNIAMHPETWLDFPLFAEFEDTSDFEMSNAQQEHAFAVESLLPRLAALRIELCPTHMTEGCFWKIYFVLLHSRLNKHDGELLSTPQIVEARAMLLQKLQNRNKQESETYNRGLLYRSVDVTSVSPREHFRSPSNLFLETSRSKPNQFEADLTSLTLGDLETERHAVNSAEVRIIEQSVNNEEHAVRQRENRWEMPVQKYEDDEDEDNDWFEEEAEGACFGIPLGNEEDVSFSDLEDDDDPRAHVHSKESSSRVPLQTSSGR